ncbi:MAG: imidazolonepropionase, partial [Pseudomonadota bacterium]
MGSVAILNTAAVMTCGAAAGGNLGILEHGAVAIVDGQVAWVGEERALPDWASRLPKLDAGNGLVTPGLVDPHTHPLFGGERSGEFAMRAAGRTYQEIAQAGGGIMATVRATRAASDEALLAGAGRRLRCALEHGTTTLEAKTGYALTVGGEIRLLRLLRELGQMQPVRLVPTLLGAHVVPVERMQDSRQRSAYVEECATSMIAGARELAAAVDVYCDEGAFSLVEARTILEAARAAGMQVRAHAGQFRDLGAAGLVAELAGLSADHLEQLSEEQAARMASAGTVATLLPGACVQLRLSPPPVALLRSAGCAMAIGTDMNPGSSMTESLPLQLWIATTHFGLTVDEAWLGVTRYAARAAGRFDAGRLDPGAAGDAVVWDATDPATVPYHYGANLVRTVVVAGVAV